MSADGSSSAIEEFLKSYFRTWSEGNIAAYETHFHPEATIKFIEDGQVVLSHGLAEFIEMQARFIAEAEQQPHEEMTSCEVRARDGVAWVAADWVLEQGSSSTRGVDHFMLVQDDSGTWKIISLVFYELED